MRKSFATYYYTKEAPEGWTGEKHSTVFKARPDQWARGYVAMPVENMVRSAKNVIHNSKQVVKKLLNK